MTRILLLGPFSGKNSGDLAILHSALNLLRQAFPGTQVTVAMHDCPAEPAPEGVTWVPDRLSWSTRLRIDRSLYVQRSRWLWHIFVLLAYITTYRLLGRPLILTRDRQKRQLLYAYINADLILANGGGYLYEYQAFSPWFLSLFTDYALAIWLAKPLVLLPQSIGPLASSWQRWLVRWLVERSRQVYVREPTTYAFLQALGVRKPVQLCPDLAFALPSADSETAQAWLRRHVPNFAASACVGLTVMNWAANCPTFTSQDQEHYELTIAGLCDLIIADGLQVVCFPQVCSAIAVQDDRLTAQRIRDRLHQPASFTIIWEQPAPEILQAASRDLRLFIGTRLHSVIFALNAGTPALAIGYQHKTRGTLHWLGWEAWQIEITTLETTALLAMVRQMLAQHADLQRQLAGRLRAVQAQVNGLVEQLAAWNR